MTTLGFRQEQDIRHPRHGFAGGCVCVWGRGGMCGGRGIYRNFYSRQQYAYGKPLKEQRSRYMPFSGRLCRIES